MAESKTKLAQGSMRKEEPKTKLGDNYDPSMYRADGSKKSSHGFLGPIKNLVDGGTMTEFSTDLGDEKRTPIPTMVPTQTPEAIEYMRNMRGGEGWDTKNNPMHKQIIDTARAHARMRISQGKSPFYIDGEEL